MPRIPDLTDPRYRDEVGWFLYHETFGRGQFGGSYDQERLAYSEMLLNEVLRALQQDRRWLADKTVVTIGCGCTGDLTTWRAAVKIAVDPLLYTYQKLGMLVPDAADASPTVYLSLGVEELPLLDECADLVVCRNALDHVPKPAEMLGQIRRILKTDGAFYLSVDIGGSPTPDEPTVFSIESLSTLLRETFEVLMMTVDHPSHSVGRVCSACVLARKKPGSGGHLDKEAVLAAYLEAIKQD
jgi:SAM-dependent methyltransferase